MAKDYPRYEKVDNYNVKIVIESPNVVSLSKLLENKKHFEEQIKKYQTQLDFCNEVIEEAKKLGIEPLPEAQKEPKNDK